MPDVPGRRAGWLLVALALAASAALALARFHSFQVGAYYDDAHYVVLAEALGSGRGMRLVSYPEAPPEWAFPPGWPLMLAPLAARFPGDYDILKLLSLACWLGSIPLVYRLSAGRLGERWRRVLTLLVALHPALVATAGMVMSEAAYLFFSLLALVLYERWSPPSAAPEETNGRAESRNVTARRDPISAPPPGEGTEDSERRTTGASWALLLAAAAVAVWAQLVRTVGVSLPVAFVAAPLLRRRWREAGLAAAATALFLLPQLAWGLWGGGALLSPGYRFHILAGSPLDRLAHMAANARDYVTILPDLLLPLFGPRLAPALARAGLGWVPAAVRAALLVGVAAGFSSALRRPRAAEVYTVVYSLAVLSFWNPKLESAQERYLLPLLPLLYLYLLRAGELAAGALARRGRLPVPGREGAGCLRFLRGERAAMALAAPLLLLLALRNVQDALHPVREAMTDLAAGASWIASHAPAGAVVMSKNPVQDYLYARRRTVAYPESARDLDATVEARGVDYVLVAPVLARRREKRLEPFAAAELLPALRARPDRYAEVFRDPAAEATVFAVRRPPER